MSHLVEDLTGEIWKPVNYFNKNQMSNYKRVAEVSPEGFRISLLPIDGKGITVINNKPIVIEYLYQQVFKAEIKEEVQRRKLEDIPKRQQFRTDTFEDSKKQSEPKDQIFAEIKNTETNLITPQEEVKKIPEKIRIMFLTEEQKNQLNTLWDESPLDNPPSVIDLTKKLFGPELDGRSPEALAIRKCLAEKGVKPKVIKDIYAERKARAVLNSEQKEFITNNCSQYSIIEMARTLFPNIKNLSAFHHEYKSVKRFAESIQNVVLYAEQKQLAEEKYKPPQTISQAVIRVNKYIPNAIKESEVPDNTKIQKQMTNLVSFMHMYRFLLLINNIDNYPDRDFFESQYVRYTWNALDMTEADLDLICNVCLDIVNFSDLQRELAQLRKMRDDGMEEKDGRLSMAVVKQIEDIRADMKENQKRQAATIASLQGTRNERAESKLKENKSVLQLIEAWRDEEKRKKILTYANKKKADIRTEIERIHNLESIKAEIFGLSLEAY